MQQDHEICRPIVIAVLAVAGLMFAVNGWGQTTESANSTELTETELSASMRDAPDVDADSARRTLNGLIQERREFRASRRQNSVDLLSRPTQDTARELIPSPRSPSAREKAKLARDNKGTQDKASEDKAVEPAPSETALQQKAAAMPEEKPHAVAAIADVKISFAPDPRQGQRAQDGEDAQSSFNAVREGEVTVIAKLEGRDAKGLPVTFNATWDPADPSTVDVSPAQGSAVKITVRGTGQSNLTVAGPGFTKDLWISAIAKEGKAIQVDISQ